MTREEEIQKAIEEEFADHLFEDESDYIMQTSKFKKGIKWADEHPRKGLWDSEKVCKVLKDYMLKERFFDNRIGRTAIIDNVICNLRKAMEE